MKRYNEQMSFDSYDRWVLGLPEETPENILEAEDYGYDPDIDYDGDDYDADYEEEE